jgi:hypothetical protein
MEWRQRIHLICQNQYGPVLYNLKMEARWIIGMGILEDSERTIEPKSK